jgi:co-chaperonin GroES (HSP10)
MTYVPLNRNVIVERKEPEKVSAGGIILHSSLEPDRAIVVATGDDSISIGEELLINWNKAYKIDSESYRIHIDDVIAVFED